MAGFDNDVFYGENADFSTANAEGGEATNGLQTDGQLWIGTTALNIGGTHINVGSITSSTLTIGYSSPDITIETAGGGQPIEQFTIDNSTVPGTNPVLPDGTGNINITGGQVVNSSLANVIQTHSHAANSYTIEIQRTAAVAATDTTKNGVSHFDSARFTVDAGGFVSTNTTGVLQTLTGDTGTATPVANNIQIAGGPGITTSASGAVVTINSVVFTDQGGSTTVTSDSGSFATAAITLTLPGSPAQGELVEFVCTSAAALVVDAPGTHLIRIGSLVSSAGGTATSTSIGDALVMRYRASDTTWYATSVIGTWVLA